MTKSSKNILVTGGAGFIGSNLVGALLEDSRIGKVRVLDNLSNGFYHNIQEFETHPDFEFIRGDIRDYDVCLESCKGIDLVSHQAALGSVPRSIVDPLTTNEVNITGTLNILQAVKESSVTRIVFAASSSTYGDSKGLPKVENIIGKPLSPYAITKYVNELYADIYAKTYKNFEYLGLRYFNIFGPKQDPNGAYAAVIPLFMKAAIEGKPPTINGDGTFSRDFTYIDNAVHANMLALFTDNQNAVNKVYNVACGERTTLNQLWDMICNEAGNKILPIHGPQRKGDIPHSLANIEKIQSLLGYEVQDNVVSGIKKAVEWYKENS
jgi:UDP-N-acetylglucosamine 4-epimerase